MPAILTVLGGILGPMLMRMGLAFIGKNVLEEALISLLGYAVMKYKAKAIASEDKLDDERAKRVEAIFEAWKSELGRIEAKK